MGSSYEDRVVDAIRWDLDGDLESQYEDKNGAPHGTEQDAETVDGAEMEEVECDECGAYVDKTDEECDACGATLR